MDLSNFKQHPKYTNIFIDRNGRLYNSLKSCVQLPTQSIVSRYPSTMCSPVEKSIPQFQLVHRLVADIYVDNPDPEKYTIINHKNGRKGDHRPENLEWVDHALNNRHAYDIGLRNDNKSIALKDVYTGRIELFSSMWRCGKFIDLNAATIHHALQPRNRSALLLGKYLVTTEREPFPEVTPPINFVPTTTLSYTPIVVKTPLGTYFSCDDTRSAATSANVGYPLLRARLGSRNRKRGDWVEVGGFYFIRNNELTEKVNLAEHHNCVFTPRKQIVRTSRKVKMTDMETGEISVFDSSTALAEYFDVKRNTLEKHIWSNEGIFRNRFLVEYLETKEEVPLVSNDLLVTH